MILDEVVLHNFGVYRGRQTIQLTPPSTKQPVILFGGFNGGGKTTLLDALQLALYGKLAQCAARGSLAYDEFLRRSIHRATHATEGAALEVQFRHHAAGQEHTYRIHRSWSQNGKGMRERVEVTHSGVFDRVFTEAWDEHVETFMPARIAPLFFFDGEKIEGLADIEHSSQLLATAVQSLLGIDLVDQLTTDLLVLERRKRTALKTQEERRRIDEAQAEVDALTRQREALVSERAALQNEVDRRRKHLRDVEARFRSEGGDLLDQREALEQERSVVLQQLHEAEDTLRELAAGPSPLLLVTDLLDDIVIQDQKEVEATQVQTLENVLVKRDQHILETAKLHGASDSLVKTLKTFLSADREARAMAADMSCYLHMPFQSRDQLQSLQRSVFAEVRGQNNKALTAIDSLKSTLADLDRKLTRIPDRDALAHLIEEQRQARGAVDEGEKQFNVVDAELERVIRDHEQKQARLVAAIEQAVEADFAHDAMTRTITHSARVRSTLEHFRTAILERHVKRISHLVLESFRHLARKEALVTELAIDPAQFTVELRGGNGQVLSPDRLSAGERQLLAVSMLWGLGRASGRPLPAVIDTPLGRLDATHRTHLVERYFPHASHQVILLSTDEEIDERYYAKLQPWVGRTYRLDFDDAADATQVHPGYFW